MGIINSGFYTIHTFFTKSYISYSRIPKRIFVEKRAIRGFWDGFNSTL